MPWFRNFTRLSWDGREFKRNEMTSRGHWLPISLAGLDRPKKRGGGKNHPRCELRYDESHEKYVMNLQTFHYGYFGFNTAALPAAAGL